MKFLFVILGAVFALGGVTVVGFKVSEVRTCEQHIEGLYSTAETIRRTYDSDMLIHSIGGARQAAPASNDARALLSETYEDQVEFLGTVCSRTDTERALEKARAILDARE